MRHLSPQMPPSVHALPRRLLPLLALLTFCQPLAAQEVHKCQHKGQTSYSSQACDKGNDSILPSVPAVDEAERSAALQRAAADKQTLAQLETQKAREAEAETRAARHNAIQQQKLQAKQQHCQLSRQRLQWAEQDAAKASLKQQAKADKRLKRAKEKVTLACAQVAQPSLQ